MVKHAARPVGKSAGRVGEVRWWGPFGPISGDPGCREKLRRQAVGRPYPKPTLVVR